MVRWLLIFLFLGASWQAAEADSARVAERYKKMLATNPAEGVALDRLWKSAQENSTTNALIEEYKNASGDFAGALIYGHLLRRAGRSDEARAAYETARALDAKSPLPHFALAQIFRERNAPADAARALESGLLFLSPEDPQTNDRLTELADAWIAAKQPAKASAVLEREIARRPDDLVLRARLADFYEKNELAAKAAPHWEYAATHGAPSARAQAWQRLSQVRQISGDPAGAIAALEEALALTAPENWLRADLQARMIKLHERVHRTAELESRWKKQAADHPRDAGAALQLADFYEHALDFAREREWREKLCLLRPQSAGDKARLARVCRQTGDLKRAASVLDEAIAAQPANADLIFARAEIDLQRGAVSDARDRVEKLLQQAFADDSLEMRATEWFRKNRLFEAVEEHLKKRAAQNDDGMISLADWYFSQGKNEDAHRVVQELLRPGRPLTEAPASFTKIAGLLRERGDFAGALEALRRVCVLQPNAPEARLSLAELLVEAGRLDEAGIEAQRAFEASAAESDREAADQKLHQIFEIRGSRLADVAGGVPALRLRNSGVAGNTRMEAFVESLQKKAAAEKTPATLLRLARWESWMKKNHEAMETIRSALQLDPGSLAARELGVEAAIADQQRPAAISFLRELVERDSARKSGWLRRLAQLEIEMKNPAGALKIYEELAGENPGDAAALRDLALAQQQANRWPDALATWQRALTASPPAKQKEIAKPLVNAMERLGMYQSAADLLMRVIEAQPGQESRSALFLDLVAVCQRHRLLGWLAEQFSAKDRQHPEDYFFAVSYAKILTQTGRAHEALGVLGDAVWTARDETEPLYDAVRKAEELGESATAIEFQRRLVALSPPAESAPWQKLADLQEADLDLDAATGTWNEIAQLFPRDVVALEHAADFFTRWNEPGRAREFWRTIRTIDPRHAESLLKLASVAEDFGERGEAISCYEQILKNTPRIGGVAFDLKRILAALSPEMNGRTRSGLARKSSARADPPAVLEPRFLAILRYARNIALNGNEAEQRAWLQRWDSVEEKAEAFWTFHFAGAEDRAMKLLRGQLASAPENQEVQDAYVSLALEAGAARTLREIFEGHDPIMDRAALVRALDGFANSAASSVRGLETVDQLFDGEIPLRSILWQAAVQLADHRRFDAAVRLGARVFEATPVLRSGIGLELAHWNLYLGHRDSAALILRESFAEPGDSFEQPVYEALREYFLLLPAQERAGFAAEFERGLDRQRTPLHACLSMALLRGLLGDRKGAEQELTRLLDLRAVRSQLRDEAGDSAYRFLSFVLVNGLRLEEWRLSPMALFWWEKALADRAAIKLQSDSAQIAVREIERRTFAIKLLHAEGAEAESMVEDYVKTTRPEGVQALSELIEKQEAPAPALLLARTVLQHEPANAQWLRNYCAACQQAHDRDAQEAALAVAAETPRDTPEARDASRALAVFYEDHGELDKAQAWMERALKLRPKDFELLERSARLRPKRGDLDGAEKTWRRLVTLSPGDAGRRCGLAEVLALREKNDEAIALLEESLRAPGADPLLVRLYLRSGKVEAAREIAMKVARSEKTNETAQIATYFAAANRTREGLRLLWAPLSRSVPTPAQLPLLTKFIELSAPEFPRLTAAALGRLREIESLQGAAAYFEIGRVPDLDTETVLAGEWRHGRGAPRAAAKLVALYLEADDSKKLDAVLQQLEARTDVEAGVLQSAAIVLHKKKRDDLAVTFLRTFCRRDPSSEKLSGAFVEALHCDGQNAEALAEAQKLAARAVMNRDIAAQVAPLLLELGDRAGAREMFELAVQDDPAARHWGTLLDYARLLREEGELRRGLDMLRQAFRNPQNDRAADLVEFYQQANRLDKLERELPTYRLTREQMDAVRAALKSR